MAGSVWKNRTADVKFDNCILTHTARVEDEMGPRIQVCFLQNICKNMIIIYPVIKAELTSKQ
jgi:hypothetical protein